MFWIFGLFNEYLYSMLLTKCALSLLVGDVIILTFLASNLFQRHRELGLPALYLFLPQLSNDGVAW